MRAQRLLELSNSC